jgi:SAM-dependent methyltransferase
MDHFSLESKPRMHESLESDTYGPYAAIYNRRGPKLVDMVVPALETLLLPHILPGAALLDLCCGSGQITEALSARGFAMTGIDISAEMIELARRNAPSCEFFLGDARTFELPVTFGAVISTLDSMNHIVRFEDLSATFANVHRALRPGGLFVFDVLLGELYQPEPEGLIAQVEEDYVMVARESFDAAQHLSRCEMTLFYREEGEERWRRWDSMGLEKFYTAAELESALRATGFINIRMYDRARDLGLEGSTRTFVVAAKPAG